MAAAPEERTCGAARPRAAAAARHVAATMLSLSDVGSASQPGHAFRAASAGSAGGRRGGADGHEGRGSSSWVRVTAGAHQAAGARLQGGKRRLCVGGRSQGEGTGEQQPTLPTTCSGARCEMWLLATTTKGILKMWVCTDVLYI